MRGSAATQPIQRESVREFDAPGLELEEIYQDTARLVKLPLSVQEAFRKSMKCSQLELRLAFYGLGRTGKSTLINALCGLGICPTTDFNETILSAFIVGTPSRQQPYSSPGRMEIPQAGFDQYVKISSVEGAHHNQATDIRNYMHERNEQMRRGLQSTIGERPQYAAQLLSDCIIVEARIPSLELGASREPTRIVLIDTPGTNEYDIGEDLENLVHKIIRFADVAVYVVDIGMGTNQKVIDDIVSAEKVVEQSGPRMLPTGLAIVFNKIDLTHDCESVKKSWLQILRETCEKEQVNYDSLAKRLCFTSARTLFAYTQVLRYEANASDAEAKSYLEAEARFERRELAEYCRNIKTAAIESKVEQNIQTLLKEECRRILESYQEHFSIYANETMRCMHELLLIHGHPAPRANPDSETTHSEALRSYHTLKANLVQRHDELRQKSIDFEKERDKACQQIQSKIHEIQASIESNNFNYDSITATLYGEIEDIIRQSNSIMQLTITEIRNILSDKQHMQFIKNADIIQRTWKEHILFLRHRPSRRSSKILLGASIGAGTGLLVGIGLAIFHARYVICAYLATRMVIDIAVSGIAGAASGALLAAIATNNSNRERNETIIKYLQKDKTAIQRLSIKLSSMTDLIGLLDQAIEIEENKIARDREACQSVAARCEHFLKAVGTSLSTSSRHPLPE